ncbi:hypothetical protein KSP40_PGU011234 [Platanthera guangdongensis]|uniref:Uncharacterized protein n=1 Tax=Platanthera guangdongensis TaxID=2320717 RepID=A0ABR2LS22_9ASPA
MPWLGQFPMLLEYSRCRGMESPAHDCSFKQAKDWTRRIGNDRHLICIEDPFEVSHDLGRVVDKFSIKILREEFERAANILQYDPSPTVTLFQPYLPPASST